MPDRIFVRDESGALVFKREGREDGKRYSDIGRDAAGNQMLREWSEAESAQRDAEESAPPPPAKLTVDFATCLERLTDQEHATLGQVEAASARFKWWMLRAAAQGTINVLSPEFTAAKTAIVQAGFFTAERFDEIFAP